MKQIGLVRQMARCLASLFLIIATSVIAVCPVAASDPINLQISNVDDVSFTVSWSTPANEKGQAQMIGGAIYDDDRGANFNGATHYITVAGLQANRAYSFDIVSGGIKYDNAGRPWTVTTGVPLEPRSPDLVVGQVKNSDGSGASGVIVLTTIQRHQVPSFSAPLSTISAADGLFHIDLGHARALSDPTRYFAYAVGSDHYLNDSLIIQAIGGRGSGSFVADMADPRLRAGAPMPMIVVNLSASEETQTLIRQQATPGPASTAPLMVTEQATLKPMPKPDQPTARPGPDLEVLLTGGLAIVIAGVAIITFLIVRRR